MSTQVESSASVGDVVKQVFSIVFVIAGLAGFYYFSEYALLYRVLSLVVIVMIAMGLMLTTRIGQGFWTFALESKQEVRKVVWPTRQETMRTTLMVFAMVLIVGVILWLLDMFLFWGVRLLTGQGG
ncbi:MAG: preprotein translocase subunit SecE [Gammaproteobacteria bacterium]|jgi:preprotein translocase subunit SecE|uniref:preprotein translocase subunit SecE n=1 Tax=unclassified Methylotuvimicrobium TaxID=2822412 RepID=UPI001D9F7B6F|nr:preprotein translocase subunit SecE [Gammaproteobacteria bacterium]